MRDSKFIYNLLVFLLAFFLSVALFPTSQSTNILTFKRGEPSFKLEAEPIEQFSECRDDDYKCWIAEYTKQIKLDSSNAEAYNARAYYFDKIGDYDEAIENYAKAIKLSNRAEINYTIRHDG